MSTDLKEPNPKPEIVTMIFKVLPELEEGEIANEEPTISSPHLKASKDLKSSSKKHQKSSSKHKIHNYSTSSDSESSDQDEQARKGWWNKKKLHVSSSQHSSSKSKEDDSDDDTEYIEKPMPDFPYNRYQKKKSKKRKNNNNNKKNHHHHSHKNREISNERSSLSSPLKEKEEKPETKKRNLYPCRSYIAFGKCDDINCHCIHAPLNKEEISRFIDENEQFFSDAFKALPTIPINPTLLPLLNQKFPSLNPQNPQNPLNLNLNNNNNTYIPRQMPPPNFISPQTLHPQYQIFSQSPTNAYPVYTFPVPQVISPQQATLSPRFSPQALYTANPSIYFEFNMQQNLTYLPQNPQFYPQMPQMLVPATILNPNFQPEIKANESPLKIQSTASVNIFTASSNNKDLLLQAPQGIGRRRSSIETAPGSETYEIIGNEKSISPENGQEDEVKKAKTAEKLTRLVELFKAKNPQKQESPQQPPSEKSSSEEKKDKETPKMTEDELFKQWEEPKQKVVKSKFDNGSANDELLKKIKSALSENPTQNGSGNVKDLVNMYLKLSKNLIAENNSVH